MKHYRGTIVYDSNEILISQINKVLAYMSDNPDGDISVSTEIISILSDTDLAGNRFNAPTIAMRDEVMDLLVTEHKALAGIGGCDISTRTSVPNGCYFTKVVEIIDNLQKLLRISPVDEVDNDCRDCGGSGYIIDDDHEDGGRCSACDGSGLAFPFTYELNVEYTQTILSQCIMKEI